MYKKYHTLNKFAYYEKGEGGKQTRNKQKIKKNNNK